MPPPPLQNRKHEMHVSVRSSCPCTSGARFVASRLLPDARAHTVFEPEGTAVEGQMQSTPMPAMISVALGFSSRSWCRTPGWGVAMPCAIWNPASCSGRSRCSVSSEGAEGSAAEPPTARRTRHSLQDTLASDGLRGGDGRYSELRASSRPTLPRPACKVGCSARCARPWHRKSSLPAPPIEPPSPIEPTGQTQTLVLVAVPRG